MRRELAAWATFFLDTPVCLLCQRRLGPSWGQVRWRVAPPDLAPALPTARLEDWLCPSCLADLLFRLERAELAGSRVGARLRAACYFQGTVRRLVHAAKFAGSPRAAEVLGMLLARAFPDCPYDLILALPLSAARERRRGYNQAERIACAAGRIWGRYPRHFLERWRDTAAQSTLDTLQARRQNVAGAFRLNAAGRCYSWQGRRVLLIDDVCTSGASLQAAAETVRAQGAAVDCLAVASNAPAWMDGLAPAERFQSL